MQRKQPKTTLQIINAQSTTRPKSIPFHKRNPQTTLYLLQKQKERYNNELSRLQQRQTELQTTILAIQTEIQTVIGEWNAEMKEIEAETQYDQHAQAQKQWKMKPMKY